MKTRLNCILKISDFENGNSLQKILTRLFRIYISFPLQSQPVYNSQLCADKLEALSQEQGREEAVVADYSEDMKLLGSRQRGQTVRRHQEGDLQKNERLRSRPELSEGRLYRQTHRVSGRFLRFERCLEP